MSCGHCRWGGCALVLKVSGLWVGVEAAWRVPVWMAFVSADRVRPECGLSLIVVKTTISAITTMRDIDRMNTFDDIEARRPDLARSFFEPVAGAAGQADRAVRTTTGRPDPLPRSRSCPGGEKGRPAAGLRGCMVAAYGATGRDQPRARRGLGRCERAERKGRQTRENAGQENRSGRRQPGTGRSTGTNGGKGARRACALAQIGHRHQGWP